MQITNKTAKQVILLNLWLIAFILVLVYFNRVRQSHQFDEIFIEAGNRYNIDPSLISAVVWKESRYDPDVVGAAGEIGLMQLMGPAALEWAEAHQIDNFKKEDLYHPVTNIFAGSWYLSKAAQQWSHKKDPLPYALAQYNAGRSRVIDWTKTRHKSDFDFWSEIPYKTTRRYVRDILQRYRGGV